MQEIRCKKCNRLLMKGQIEQVEIKCPKCGYLNQFITLGKQRELDETKFHYDFEEKPIEAYFKK